MSLSPGAIRFTPPPAGLRDSFKSIVQEEFRAVMSAAEGEEGRAHMTKAYESLVDKSTGALDLSALPEKTRKDLEGLAESAEGFETIFIKGLLSQMRKSSFAEKTGPYGEMANDFMDQALAEQTAASGGGAGIAASVFRSIAPRLLREAPGLAQAASQGSAGAPILDDLNTTRSQEGTDKSKGTAKA